MEGIMASILTKVKNFLVEDDGATAVEYGIMVAAIAAVIITIVFSVGDRVLDAFTTVDDNMATEMPGT